MHILQTLRAKTQAFGKDRKGVSAIEFALILPVLIALFFGSVEISFLMMADRKVTATASSMGDLTARVDSVTRDEVEDIFSVSNALIEPFAHNNMQMRLTSVEMVGGQGEVQWSVGKNMGERSGKVDLPSGIIKDGESVIFAEVSYRFNSPLGFFIPNGINLSDEFYLRPRQSDSVALL